MKYIADYPSRCGIIDPPVSSGQGGTDISQTHASVTEPEVNELLFDAPRGRNSLLVHMFRLRTCSSITSY